MYIREYTFALGGQPSLQQSAVIEAYLRRHPKVISAVLGSDCVKVHTTADLLKKETASLAALVLKADPNASDVTLKNHPDEAGTAALQDQSNEMIRAKISCHKKHALLSLVFFAGFEILKRTNPALYASTAWLRHLTILAISAPLFKEGLLDAARKRRPNADTLTCTAVLASIAAGKPESSLSLLALSNFAETLAIMAAQRARQNIGDLIGLNVQEVWLKQDNGHEIKVHISQIKPHMTAAFHPGEKICIDGIITLGTATIDEAAITGESVPVVKKAGDLVYAGSVIMAGEIDVEILKAGDDTSLSRIVHMVENAQTRRAPIQNYADKMAASLVPVSFIAALVVYLATRDLQRVLNMLFIDFSCGLKLSTATAMSAAISAAASQGILVKGGSFIEAAASIDTIILDKTGTITRGRPEVTAINCLEGFSQEKVIALAAATEIHSTHPMALAILDKAAELEIAIPEHNDTKTILGRGMAGDIRPFEGCPGGKTLIGSRRLMQEHDIAGLDFKVQQNSDAGSLIYIAFEGRLAGVLEISDPVRDDFKRTINRLRHLGIEEIVMLTGDNKAAARDISQKLALDGFLAEVLPEEKAGYVAARQAECNVLMVGDGINDAPALAYADIGVAMGTGCTDTAMEIADVTINSDDPLKLPLYITISRDTMHLVQQNFTITILVNTAAMMLGALGVINPMIASVVHNASTLGVVANSVRVLISHKKT